VLENKTGAGGNIAAELVARSDPDGYTIYIAAVPHATNRYLSPRGAGHELGVYVYNDNGLTLSGTNDTSQSEGANPGVR
jgi:hypothetical protein